MSDALRASYQFCGEVSRREARNFYYSFLLLPPAARRSMCALYAFLRQTDDLADGSAPASEKHGMLADWRTTVSGALAGGSADGWPGLAALVDTVERHAIPRAYLDEVLDGVAMDLDPRTFATFDDLYGYCYRVASAVGLCCIHIWGFRSDGGRAEALAEACGIALQLTNILRDVREDSGRGRVYLPDEDLERFGVRAEDLSTTRVEGRLRDLLEFEARRAYDYYDQAGPLVGLVEPVGRPVLRTIVGIYRALLDEIARRDYEVLAGRVAIPSWRKASITLRSLAARFAMAEAYRAESPRC
jgi:phytoene synthase